MGKPKMNSRRESLHKPLNADQILAIEEKTRLSHNEPLSQRNLSERPAE